jgi:hypothetical protein
MPSLGKSRSSGSSWASAGSDFVNEIRITVATRWRRIAVTFLYSICVE